MAKKKTSEDHNEVNAYLKTIRRYTPMSLDEEKKVLEKYYKGSKEDKKEAVKQLVMTNQRFVFSVAKSYAKYDEAELLDYVSEGNMGIINAIEKFDPSRGFKFITFAVWYIRQAMTNYAQTSGQFIRKSNGPKIGNNILKIRSAYLQNQHREPSIDEVKEELAKKGIKIKNNLDLEDVSRSSIDSAWCDESTFENNPRYIQHSAVDNEYEKEAENEYAKTLVEKLLSKFDSRSAAVVKQLYGIGYDYPVDIEVVAENLGLTPTRVGQIKNAVIKKLREAVSSHTSECRAV